MTIAGTERFMAGGSEYMIRADGDGEPGVGGVVDLSGSVDVRPLRTHGEFQACVELQRLTWGADFEDVVPASLLKVVPRIGGVVAGAFDASGRLLGFVFGLTGLEGGRIAHWSHMLAVHPAVRNHGIGRRLKEYQRETLLGLGVESVFWTFDPLVARNAHLNLTRLGAEVVDFYPDMYGRTGSILHTMGTDRLVVVWRIGARRGRDASAVGDARSAEVAAAPVVNRGPDGGPAVVGEALEGHPLIRIEVPPDIEALRSSSESLALRWRDSIRQSFLRYLGDGYRVVGFYRGLEDGRCHYALAFGPSIEGST